MNTLKVPFAFVDACGTGPDAEKSAVDDRHGFLILGALD